MHQLIVYKEKVKERRFIHHNTNRTALNNDSNKTQSKELPQIHKAHLSWPGHAQCQKYNR